MPRTRSARGSRRDAREPSAVVKGTDAESVDPVHDDLDLARRLPVRGLQFGLELDDLVVGPAVTVK